MSATRNRMGDQQDQKRTEKQGTSDHGFLGRNLSHRFELTQCARESQFAHAGRTERHLDEQRSRIAIWRQASKDLDCSDPKWVGRNPDALEFVPLSRPLS